MIDRLSKVRAKLDEWRIDGLLITSPSNRRWLSGFTGSAGRLLVTREQALLSTDSRYWEQAVRQAPNFELYRHRDKPEDTARFFMLGGAKRIGFEARHMTVSEHRRLKREKGYSWRALDRTFEEFRAVKSPEELDAIRTAARITDETIALFHRIARPGKTERALAWELEKAMRDVGADKAGFDIIVASGPNSALPHHRPGDRQLQRGDIIIVDLGSEVNGYRSDLTRTFYLGEEPDERFWQIYRIVHKAQAAAIESIRSGILGQAVDRAAREIIAEAGYGDHFGHGTGHGVGLDIHEEPRFSPLAGRSTVPAGSVMTVEPGIYLPGYGGVRIEDLVLVAESGPKILSQAAKEPVIPL